jgi:hypothetical protein
MGVQLERKLSRGIEAKPELAARCRTALRLLRHHAGVDGAGSAECPYSFEQILGTGGEEDWFPAPR